MNEQADTCPSESHRRGIACALVLFDEMLCCFERWANGMTAKGMLHKERDSLTAHQKRLVLAEIAQTREILRALRDGYRLPPKVVDTAQSIWAQSLAFWPVLVELQSKDLRRYGEIPPTFAAHLDERIADLIHHLGRIADAVKAPDPEHNPPAPPSPPGPAGEKTR